MPSEQVLLGKYVNFNTKLLTKSNYNNVNFVTGKDSNCNYYKIKYTNSNKEEIKHVENIISSMKYKHGVRSKKDVESKKNKPTGLNGKKKFKEFITSLNISRPVSATSNNEEVVDKKYTDSIKKKLFSNDIVLEKIISNFDVEKNNEILFNNLMFLNKQISKIVTKHVYKNIYIESTYRLSQFLNTIKCDMMKKHNSKHLDCIIESIDLSGIKSGSELFKLYAEKIGMSIKDNQDDMSLATWRDWRMKDSKIYGRNLLEMQHNMRKRAISTTSLVTTNTDKHTNPIKKMKFDKSPISSNVEKLFNRFCFKKRKINNTKRSFVDIGSVININNQLSKIKHPLINQHLQKYKDNRDIPIGYIIHILKYFKNLKILILDHLSISEDLIFLKNTSLVNSPDLNFVKDYLKNRNDDFKFLSDTGINSFNLKLDKYSFGLTFYNFFETFICLLFEKKLEFLSLRNCYFVNKSDVGKLLESQYNNSSAMNMDFYKSTMNKNYLWCNTPIVDNKNFLIFFFLSNLIENVKKQNYLAVSTFSKNCLLDTEDFLFKSQYFSLNGDNCDDSNDTLKFLLCYGLNRNDSDFDYSISKLKSNVIQIKFVFNLKTYMETNDIFLKETEFFNFHNNMSFLRLGESFKNEKVDPRYYNLKILAEYLLIRMKIEFLVMKHKTIGYNMIQSL